jgi:hypothetical protein
VLPVGRRVLTKGWLTRLRPSAQRCRYASGRQQSNDQENQERCVGMGSALTSARLLDESLEHWRNAVRRRGFVNQGHLVKPITVGLRSCQ